MSKMQPPTLKVLRFENEDVIATSGGVRTLTWRGLGNTTAGDAIINFGGDDYGNDRKMDLLPVLSSAFNLSGYVIGQTIHFVLKNDTSAGTDMSSLFFGDNSSGSYGDYDGSYSYDPNYTPSSGGDPAFHYFIHQ